MMDETKTILVAPISVVKPTSPNDTKSSPKQIFQIMGTYTQRCDLIEKDVFEEYEILCGKTIIHHTIDQTGVLWLHQNSSSLSRLIQLSHWLRLLNRDGLSMTSQVMEEFNHC